MKLSYSNKGKKPLEFAFLTIAVLAMIFLSLEIASSRSGISSANSNLTVWDDSDSRTVYANFTRFYANFTSLANSTFGDTTAGNEMDYEAVGTNTVWVTNFSLTENAIATQVRMFTRVHDGIATGRVKALIYDDLNGAPNNLKATSIELTVNATADWYNFTISNPVGLAPGNYWMGLISGNDSLRYIVRADAAAKTFWGTGNYDSPAAAWPGTSGNDNGYSGSVYVEYTKAVSVNGSNVGCEFRQNRTGIWQYMGNMSFNSSTLVYEFTGDCGYLKGHSCLPVGNYSYNITCYDGATDYANLSVSDTVAISEYPTSLTVSNESDKYIYDRVMFFANYSAQNSYGIAGMRNEIGRIIWNTTDLDGNDYTYALSSFDSNRDGKLNELILGTRPQVRLFLSNGTNAYSSLNQLIKYSFIPFDGNNDSYKDELLSADYNGRVYILNSTMGVIWNQTIIGTSDSDRVFAIATGDLDGDGVNNDFVAGIRSGYVMAFNSTNATSNNWTQMWNISTGGTSNYIPEVAIYDLNRDGNNEVIFISATGHLSVYYKNGSLLWNTSRAMSSFEILDADNDGFKDDIVAFTNSGGNKLIAFNESGFNIWNNTGGTIDDSVYEIKAGDVNNDGINEIFAGHNYQHLNSYYYNGTNASRWDGDVHQTTQWVRGIIVEDLDADGKNEILYTAGLGNEGDIFMLESNENLSLRWKYNISQGYMGTTYGKSEAFKTMDINNDGILEVIAASQRGYAHVLQDVSCFAGFNDTTAVYNMTWNDTSKQWETNRTFNVSANFSYNVTCLKGGYVTQTSSGNVSLGGDVTFPIFYNYIDNNGSLMDSGLATFNVSVNNTNGTVFLNINGNSYPATNLSGNMYNVSLTLTNKTYMYNWTSYGNWTGARYNISSSIYYMVNVSVLHINFSSPSPSNTTDSTNVVFNVTSNSNLTQCSLYMFSKNPAKLRSMTASTGEFHTCYVLTNGNSTCYGTNTYGQAENYTGGDAVAVSSGYRHTCYLLSNGNVSCIGGNLYGESKGYGGQDAIQVSAGGGSSNGITCYLFANGTSRCDGYNANGAAINYTGGDAVAVFVGQNYACYLLNNGNSKCFGSNSGGQATNYSGGDAIQVSTGWDNTCYLLRNGTSICYGSNGAGETTSYLQGDAVTLTTRYQHSCYVLYNGSGICYNAANFSSGQALWTSVGAGHTCFLLSNGNSTCYGDNTNGRATDYGGGDIVIPDTALKVFNMSITNADANTFANYTVQNLSRDNYTYYVTCQNTTGIINSLDLRPLNVTDSTAATPNITIVSPANQSYTTRNILINISNSSNAQAVWWYNGTGNTTYTSEIYFNFSEGSTTIFAYANNSEGDLNETNVTFFIDTVYPIFSSYWDNNASLTNSGIARFNVTIENTNGTVFLEINNTNITATNVTSNVYNASYNFTSNGNYSYRWHSWGNGSSQLYNFSGDRIYTVLFDDIYPVFYNYLDNNGTLINAGIATFNVSVNNTNGTVIFRINGTAYRASNISNMFNVSINLRNGTYTYNWTSYGNGTGKNLNVSSNIAYTVNLSIYPNITFVSPSSIDYNTTIILVNISNSSNAQATWWYNETGNTTYTGPVQMNLSEGSHTFLAYANNSDGTLNTTSVTFFIDSDPWPWWNSSWSYRMKINITNPNATASVPNNYTINLTINTTDSKFLSNGSDLRIVYYYQNNSYELDRLNFSSFNSTTTIIWFKLQTNITASGSDANYYAYYGNPSAGNPPENKSNVWLFYDDFNRDNTVINSTTDSRYLRFGGATWAINSSMLRGSGGSGDPNKLAVISIGNRSDVEMTIKIMVETYTGGDGSRPGLSSKMYNANGQGYFANLHTSEGTIQFLNDYIAWGNSATGTWSIGNWSYLKFQNIATNLKAKIWNESLSEPGVWNITQSAWGNRTAGLVGIGMSNANDRVFYDDFAVRLVNSIEPATSLFGEEQNDGAYPIFYNYLDNNGTITHSGLATFNVSVNNTNGTVILNINGTAYSASNISNMFNVSISLTNGTYSYNWTAYGNGTSALANNSANRDYVVNVLDYIGINFSYPTPTDVTNTTNTSAEINISITSGYLKELSFNWNGTNYTLYNDSLALMMNFDNLSSLGENATYAVDVSKYSNNGTLKNGATWNASGKYGGACSFRRENNSYIDLGSNNDTIDLGDGNRSKSVSFWFYPKTIEAGWNVILAKDRHNSGYEGYAYVSNNGFCATNDGPCTGAGSILANRWYHGLIIWNTTTVSVYLNGALRNQATESTFKFHPNENLMIGARNNNNGGCCTDYFNGSIDEVRIWNRSLSAAEVYQQYASNLNKFNQTQWFLQINQSKNSTAGLSPGNYTYYAYAKDIVGNENQTEIRMINISNFPDTEYPLFSNYGSTANNTEYAPGKSYVFNVTITNTNRTAGIEFNGTNYTLTNVSSYFYWNTTNLRAGNYSYYFWSYGNGTLNNFNNSQRIYYTIARNSSYSLNLSVNPSWTIDYGTQTNVTASGCPSQMTCSLYSNNVSATSGINETLGGGTYNYTYNSSGNANYSEKSFSRILTVSPISSAVYIYLNNSRSNITIYNNTAIWLNATLINGSGGIKLYKNDALINTGSSPLSNLTDFNSTGQFNITAIYDTTQNYSGSYETFWVNVTGLPPDNEYPVFYDYLDNNGSIINSGIARFNVSVNNTNGTVIFRINGTAYLASNVSNMFNVSISLTNGTYSYNWTAYGNGTGNNLNVSSNRNYIANYSGADAIIVSPANQSYTTRNILINISNSSFTQSIWWYNGTGNTTYTEPVYFNFSEGSNIIFAYSNDSLGNINTTNVTFNVDTVYPIFYDYLDNNASIVNIGVATFNVSVNNTNGTVILNINGNRYSASNISNMFNVSLSLNNGTYMYNWTAYGNGTGNNLNVSELRVYTANYSDTNLTILSPLNQSYTTRNILINLTNYTETQATWWYNGTGNTTYTEPVYFNFSEGSNIIFAYANNSLGELNTSNVTFFIDTVYPEVSLVYPDNLANYSSNSQSIIFYYNVTEVNVKNCSLTVNSQTVNASANINGSGGNNTLSYTFTPANYSWNVTCFDAVEHSNFSDTRNFTITGVYVPPAPSSSGGGGGGSAVEEEEKPECIKDLDCNGTYVCYASKCVKLFDAKINRIESPINPKGFFDFTYYIKGMADIKGDVIVKFWLERNGTIVTSGQDTVYLGVFEEKTENASLFLPSKTLSGVYDFYVEVNYERYKATSYRKIEVIRTGKGDEILEENMTSEQAEEIASETETTPAPLSEGFRQTAKTAGIYAVILLAGIGAAIGGYFLAKLIAARIKRINFRKNARNGWLTGIVGMEVYSDGYRIGTIEEAYLSHNRVDEWLIHLDSKFRKELEKSKLIIKQENVHIVKRIMIIDKGVIKSLEAHMHHQKIMKGMKKH